jgi:hypothetical protein
LLDSARGTPRWAIGGRGCCTSGGAAPSPLVRWRMNMGRHLSPHPPQRAVPLALSPPWMRSHLALNADWRLVSSFTDLRRHCQRDSGKNMQCKGHARVTVARPRLMNAGNHGNCGRRRLESEWIEELGTNCEQVQSFVKGLPEADVISDPAGTAPESTSDIPSSAVLRTH